MMNFEPGVKRLTILSLTDLALALKWVHSNVRSFNGDPDRITLLGLGSGAAAAGLLMVRDT
jgi:para-nitrobenzyl esterase